MADDTAKVIPVSIVLREGKFRSVEAGPAVQVESGEQRLTGDVGFRDTNLGGLGWQFEQTVTAGIGSELPFGEIVTFDPKTDLAPIVDMKGKLTIPHVGLRHLSFTQTGQVLLDFKSGLKYFEPSWSPGVSLSEWPVPHTALGLDYRVSYFTVVGTPGTTTEFCDPTTNQPITDDAFLSMVDESVSYSSKNDLFEPNRGWVWQVDATQAGGLLGGDSDFLRGRGSVVKYTSIPHLFGFNPDLWVVAARVGGGIIQPYGDTTATDVPWSERLFLGGGSSVRGWPARELGPMGSLTSCDSTDSVNGAQPRPDTGPIGGDLSLYGNLEMRVGWFHDFGLAVFTDMGQVWATPGDFTWLGESGLQVSFGGGIRYHSPIGTIRVDLTRRLGTAWRDVQPPITPDLALTEAF
jgi:outer membrane protein assembly factor BamA